MFVAQHEVPATHSQFIFSEPGLGPFETGVLLFESEVLQTLIDPLPFSLPHPRGRRA
jgi:hypothetical protein